MADEKASSNLSAAGVDLAAKHGTQAFRRDVKKDYSEDFKTQFPQAEQLAKSGKIDAACELMLLLEKQARVANDMATIKQAALAVVTFCYEAKDWDSLCKYTTVISKRRQQKGSVVAAVVQKVMEYKEDAEVKANKDLKFKMIECLRVVSDGKIYVERERAMLTLELAHIKEKDGLVAEAADILNEVHVETYGSMNKIEKVEYILEQVRLTILKKDYVRAHIVSKKINRKWLVTAGFGAIKIKFYTMMIEYHVREGDMMELFKCYNQMYNTPQVQADPVQWQHYLPYAVLFLLLSPYGPEQNNMLHTLAADPKLKEFEGGAWHALLQHYITQELAAWPLPQLDMAFKHPVFSGQTAVAVGAPTDAQKQAVSDTMKAAVEDVEMADADDKSVFKKEKKKDEEKKEEEEKKEKEQQSGDTPDFELAPYTMPPYHYAGKAEGEEGWQQLLHTRTVEHNLRVVSKCYTRIRIQHLASMLGLTTDEVEKHMANLVTKSIIYARIDRPAGIAVFTKPDNPEEKLNVFGADLSELLDLMETTCHLVHKENMRYKIKA